MTKNLDKDGLRSIVENYDIFYIDLWGVVHNGITLHKNAIEALEEITKANKDYVLLTNAPRPNTDHCENVVDSGPRATAPAADMVVVVLFGIYRTRIPVYVLCYIYILTLD